MSVGTNVCVTATFHPSDMLAASPRVVLWHTFIYRTCKMRGVCVCLCMSLGALLSNVSDVWCSALLRWLNGPAVTLWSRRTTPFPPVDMPSVGLGHTLNMRDGEEKKENGVFVSWLHCMLFDKSEMQYANLKGWDIMHWMRNKNERHKMFGSKLFTLAATQIWDGNTEIWI